MILNESFQNDNGSIEPDLSSFPIIRIDQIHLIDSSTLRECNSAACSLLKEISEELIVKSGSIDNVKKPGMISYLERQIQAVNNELIQRAARERIDRLLRSDISNLSSSDRQSSTTITPRVDHNHLGIKSSKMYNLIPLPSEIQSASLREKLQSNHILPNSSDSGSIGNPSNVSERSPNRTHPPQPPNRKAIEQINKNFGNVFIVAATERKIRNPVKKIIAENPEEQRERIRLERRKEAMRRLMERRENRQKQLEKIREKKRQLQVIKLANNQNSRDSSVKRNSQGDADSGYQSTSSDSESISGGDDELDIEVDPKSVELMEQSLYLQFNEVDNMILDSTAVNDNMILNNTVADNDTSISMETQYYQPQEDIESESLNVSEQEGNKSLTDEVKISPSSEYDDSRREYSKSSSGMRRVDDENRRCSSTLLRNIEDIQSDADCSLCDRTFQASTSDTSILNESKKMSSRESKYFVNDCISITIDVADSALDNRNSSSHTNKATELTYFDDNKCLNGHRCDNRYLSDKPINEGMTITKITDIEELSTVNESETPVYINDLRFEEFVVTGASPSNQNLTTVEDDLNDRKPKLLNDGAEYNHELSSEVDLLNHHESIVTKESMAMVPTTASNKSDVHIATLSQSKSGDGHQTMTLPSNQTNTKSKYFHVKSKINTNHGLTKRISLPLSRGVLSEIYPHIGMIFAVTAGCVGVQHNFKQSDNWTTKTLIESMHLQCQLYDEWMEIMGDYATVFHEERGFDFLSTNPQENESKSVYSGNARTLHYRVKSSRPEVGNIITDVLNRISVKQSTYSSNDLSQSQSDENIQESSSRNHSRRSSRTIAQSNQSTLQQSSLTFWQELPQGLGLGLSWNLLWTWSKPHVNTSHLLVWQKINHFDDNKHLTRKDLLRKSLQRFTDYSGKVAESFDIMPQTFILPHEYPQFVTAFTAYETKKSQSLCRNNYWIMKPVGLSRGRGISLINDINSVIYSQPTVIQKYIDNPALLNGYKFDLRLYVLVTSFQPLEAFIYKEGFARLSTQLYTNSSNMIDNKFIHLTNSSIQKYNHEPLSNDNPLQDHSNDVGGSKICLLGSGGLWKRLESSKSFQNKNLTIDDLWQRICEVVMKSLITVDDKIRYQPCSFEVFGYDILFDDDYSPWLIEVNASPSLARENAIDHRVKNSLIQDTIELIDPAPYDRHAIATILKRRLNEISKAKVIGTNRSDILLEQDLKAILGDYVPRRYGEIPKRLGDYQRLCPETKVYDHVIKMKNKLIRPMI